jgi:hypothetical protein
MGTIASNLFDCTDKGLYDFAVHHLKEMPDDLKARYYALHFQPRSAGADRSGKCNRQRIAAQATRLLQ